AEDALFASDYDDLCRLCEEEEEQRGYCGYRHAEQEEERKGNSDEEESVKEELKDEVSHELKTDVEVKEEGRPEEHWTIDQESEDGKTEDKGGEHDVGPKNTDEHKKEDFVSIYEMYKSKQDTNEDLPECSAVGLEDNETKTDYDDHMTTDLVGVPPLEEDCILQMGPDCTIDFVMVCEQSVERCMSEECPPKSSNLPQPPIESPHSPLTITLPPPNHPTLPLTFQPQPALQAQVPTQALFEAPCMRKRPYDSSPLVEPQATVPSTGQVEVRLRNVYTTRRYTRFTSRTAPMLHLQSVSGETSTHTLPSISSDAPLMPPMMPPKKKTRTFYSTDQLVELERVFQDDHYPDGDKRKEIAAAIGVTPQRIMVWFQNRRAKWRKTAKTTAKRVPSRGQPFIQVNRPPIFTGPAVAPPHPKPGNTLPPYSTILTSCTSPPGPSCVDMGPCMSQGGFLEYMPPPMHSPPPIRRASLPLITAYNPPSHTVSLLLDTPEHSEVSSTDTTQLGLQTDPGFDYDSLSSSIKLDYMTSAPPNNSLNFQLNTFPQQSNTLLTQQTNTLLSQQTNTLLPQQTSCLIPQQNNTLLPQYSHLSYLTPSPYLTPNPTEGSSTPYLPITTGTNNTLPVYTSSGHAYLQSQTGNQMLLQSGVHAFQTHPWTTDVYSQSGQFTQTLFRPQLSSQGHEGHYHQLLPQQHYVQLQEVPQSSLSKATPDPLLPNIKAESEDTGHSQAIRVIEAEPTFHCDFSPIHF
ncbi:putative homeobox protein NOBOX, partial [Triplophysa rosa]